ncbi:MAG: LysR family transcriptional regulator [Boseongicola sp.]
MNLKSLRAFINIMDEGTLVAASKKMNLSQPAASRLIQLLEAEIGAKLFYRDQKSLAPTPEAELFYPEAQNIVSSVDDFPQLFRRLRDNTLVPLRVVSQLRPAHGLVIPAMVKLTKIAPDVRIALDVHPRRELSRRITQEKFDVAIYVVPMPVKGAKMLEMWETKLQVLLPKGHHLSERPFLTPRDMKNEKYVALRRGLMGREAVDGELARAGEKIEVFHEVSGTSAAQRLVAGGVGYTFTDATVLEPNFRDETVLVPWKPEVKISLGLFSPENYAPHEASEAFFSCLKEVWEDKVGPVTIPQN